MTAVRPLALTLVLGASGLAACDARPGRDEAAPPAAPAGFDHGVLDGLLAEHVDAQGLVDYAGLARDAARLDAYLESLATAPVAALARDERLALLIDAYNAGALRLVLDHWPLGSIQDVPDERRFGDVRFDVGGRRYSLDQLEHQAIRANFAEALIHFALVCAARGCPPLRREAYVGPRLDLQLDDQARRVHAGERWFAFDPASNVTRLTRLYDWYGDDFRREAGSVLGYAARWSAPLEEALAAGRTPAIEWLDYDWSLNAQAAPIAPAAGEPRESRDG